MPIVGIAVGTDGCGGRWLREISRRGGGLALASVRIRRSTRSVGSSLLGPPRRVAFTASSATLLRLHLLGEALRFLREPRCLSGSSLDLRASLSAADGIALATPPPPRLRLLLRESFCFLADPLCVGGGSVGFCPPFGTAYRITCSTPPAMLLGYRFRCLALGILAGTAALRLAFGSLATSGFRALLCSTRDCTRLIEPATVELDIDPRHRPAVADDSWQSVVARTDERRA